MKTLKLKDNIYWCGVIDAELKTFDIIMETEFGTTYNSYLVKGTEKTALIETAKETFCDEYLSGIISLVSPEKIDYIIVNHTEPDHAGSAARLLELNPEITVVGTAGAINFLQNIVNRTFKSKPVRDGDSIQLGERTLCFRVLPQLHWPDTMYTFIPEDNVLFTCDSFGAHYAKDGILRSRITDEQSYHRAAKYYFDCILAPFKRPFMKTALDCVKGLDVNMICPGHGPVLDSHLDELMALYAEWCEQSPEEPDVVVMPYVSAYGYTRRLAEEIASGVLEGGKKPELYDMQTADKAEVMARIAVAGGVLLGSPTILGEALKPILELTAGMTPVTHQQKFGSAFGSYGWSGEAVPHLTERLTQLRMRVSEGYRVRFKPSEEQLKAAREFGKAFAEGMKK